MKKRWRVLCAALGAAVALIALFSFVYAGHIVVDSFNEGDEDYEATAGSCASATYDNTGIVGGERDSEICTEGNYTRLQVDYGSSNKLQLSASDGATYTADLVWDGNDNNATSVDYDGLGGFDLISDTNDGFLLTVLSKDQGNLALTFEVYTTSSNWSTSTLIMPSARIDGGERVDLIFPFSGFGTAGGTGADFSSAGAIVLRVDGTLAVATDVSIDVLETTSLREYGDLPTDTYGTTMLSANHVPGGLRLGNNLDAESTYNTSYDAKGDDDTDTPDDEDGVTPQNMSTWYDETISGVTEVSDNGRVQYVVQGCPDSSCYVNGWVDWNRDGDFEDSWNYSYFGGSVTYTVTEYIVVNEQGGDGTYIKDFLVPLDIIADDYHYVRFRVCDESDECNTPDGNATNGEIEDYRWALDPTAITLTDITARSSTLTLALGAVALAAVGLLGAAVILRRRRT